MILDDSRLYKIALAHVKLMDICDCRVINCVRPSGACLPIFNGLLNSC